MFTIPPWPTVPAEQRGAAPVSLRYEDVTQDGRLLLHAIPHAIGEVLWQHVLERHPMRGKLADAGIIPILTRLITEGTGSPLAVRKPLEGEGGFELAHTVDQHGAVDRLVMNLWVDVYGPRGRTWGPQPPGSGERIHVGRVFGEHVFTRPFAPPAERKVLRLEGGEPADTRAAGASAASAPCPANAGHHLPAVPPARYVWRRSEELLDLPPGAEPLDAELLPDDAPTVLGLGHTDSNQHVNSLVYPRMFEEAALRRFAARGRGAQWLARFSEFSYRKPSFAGDRVRFRLRAFAWEGKVGAVGVLVDDEDAAARPRCFARMLFEP
jgi:hypothetical protein